MRRGMERWLGLLTLTAVIGSCDGGTAPEATPFTVAMPWGARVTGNRSTNELGDPEVRCDYTVQVSATGGEAGHYAQWVDGLLEWRRVGDGADETMSASELVQLFGSQRLVPGANLDIPLWASWSSPFTLNHVFRYRLHTGRTDSVSYFLQCL